MPCGNFSYFKADDKDTTMPENSTKISFLRLFRNGILCSLLFCGCVPVTNDPLTPFSLPAQFSETGENRMAIRWWDDLDDPPLSKLINSAITDNFTLLIARNRLLESQAIARQAGAFLLPSLDIKGTAATSRNHTLETTSNSIVLGLAASYELDLWGRVRSLRDAAELNAIASKEDYHTAVISLTAEVAKSWYQLVETHLQLDLLRNQRSTNSKVLDLISVHFRAGQAGIADVLQQRQLVEAGTGDIAALQADKRILEHQLAILLGKTPGTISLPTPGKLPVLLPLPETGLPINLLSTRPDIKSSYFRLRAADYNVAAAVADRLPRLSISADITTTGKRASDLFNNWISSLGANLFGPLIDGGQRKAEVDRTGAIAKQKFYRYGQTVIEAIGEVENSLIQEKEQRKIITSLEIRLQLAADSIEHIGHRYRQGADDYQRVLLALLSHQGVQRTLLFNRLQLINYRIALYRALSGSTPYLTANKTQTETQGSPIGPTGTQ